MTEVWKDVVGWEGLYKISSTGKVVSLKTKDASGKKLPAHRLGITLAYCYCKRGYQRVHLNFGKRIACPPVHRLLAMAFIPNPDNKPTVNHKNGIKTDNTISNLEWLSYSENSQHAHDTGLIPKQRKSITQLQEWHKSNRHRKVELSTKGWETRRRNKLQPA